MSQNMIFANVKRSCMSSSSKRSCQRIIQCQSRYSSSWFRRFISPSEEKALYLGITSSFREKLVEQSHKSTKLYGNMIENAILSAENAKSTTKTGQLSIDRINQIKTELDNAGKQKDVAKLLELQKEMEQGQLRAVTVYNRLIRAYIASNHIDLAEDVLIKLEARGLMPTTRTYTYIVQANVKAGHLEKARKLIEQMQDLSLMKLRTGFDCNVVMEFYEACGDRHAIEFLWRDIMQHVDTIKPGIGLYTHYLNCLLHNDNSNIATTSSIEYNQKEERKETKKEKEFGSLVQLTKDMIQRGEAFQFNTYQYTRWIHSASLLAPKHTMAADNLLFYLLPKMPSQQQEQQQQANNTSWLAERNVIHKIVDGYIEQDQELKALSFYYRLQKMSVPNKAFDSHVVESVKRVLSRAEQRQELYADEENKAIMAEFGLLRPSSAE